MTGERDEGDSEPDHHHGGRPDMSGRHGCLEQQPLADEGPKGRATRHGKGRQGQNDRPAGRGPQKPPELSQGLRPIDLEQVSGQ